MQRILFRVGLAAALVMTTAFLPAASATYELRGTTGCTLSIYGAHAVYDCDVTTGLGASGTVTYCLADYVGPAAACRDQHILTCYAPVGSHIRCLLA